MAVFAVIMPQSKTLTQHYFSDGAKEKTSLIRDAQGYKIKKTSYIISL